YIVGGHAGLRQRLLGFLDAGVLDEGRIVRLLPDSIIKGRHFHGADLVLVKALAAVGRRLSLRRPEDGETGIDAERGGQAGGKHDVTTRHVEHEMVPFQWPCAGRRLGLLRRGIDWATGAVIPGRAASRMAADHDRVRRTADKIRRDGGMTGIKRSYG